MSARVLISTTLVLLLLFNGCSDSKPRSAKEIDAERMSLPALFMTPSGKRIEAPTTQAVFVDKDSGELAWPVYECTNPQCPGRIDNKTHLFIWSDPRFYVTESGELGTRDFDTIQEWRSAVAAEGSYREPTCEKCLEIRDQSSESDEEQLKYSNYPQTYVLPATAKRMKELDDQNREWDEYIREKMKN